MLKIFLLLATCAHADSTVQDRHYASELYKQIAPQAKSINMTCALDTECTLTWTPKPGAKISFVDKRADADKAKLMVQKLRDGKLTSEEKDWLLLYLADRVLGS